MDGLHEMAGSGVPVEIGGTTYQLRPLRAKDWGEAARTLISKKRPALDILKDAAKGGLPDDAMRAMVDLAWADERSGEMVPAFELDRWFRRGDGAVFQFWLMIRQAHEEISLERAETLYDMAKRDDNARQTLAVQRLLNEGHVLGNLLRPPGAGNPTTTSDGPSHGEPSIGP